MTTRRGFLGALLAAAAAPALVRASSLMPIYVPPAPKILTPADFGAVGDPLLTLWADGVHDDTAALQALIGGAAVLFNGKRYGGGMGGVLLPSGTIRTSGTLELNEAGPPVVSHGLTLCSSADPVLRVTPKARATFHQLVVERAPGALIQYTR